GTVLDGHHRLRVLVERGADIRHLPREITAQARKVSSNRSLTGKCGGARSCVPPSALADARCQGAQKRRVETPNSCGHGIQVEPDLRLGARLDRFTIGPQVEQSAPRWSKVAAKITGDKIAGATSWRQTTRDWAASFSSTV